MVCTPTRFKKAASRFVSGITIVLSGRPGNIHGITLSAFSSISLSPPIIMVSINRQSSLHDLVTATGAFTVNILSAHQSEMSEAFARPGRTAVTSLDELGLPHRMGLSGVPILEGSASYFDCELADIHMVGDHSLLIGSVLDADAGSDAPLVYFSRSYHQLADSTSASN